MLIIGTRGLEGWLLALLRECLPNVEALHVVSDTPDRARTVADRFVESFERVQGLKWASSKRLNVKIEYFTYPSDDVKNNQWGTAGYVGSPAFDRFAKFEPSS